MSEFIDRADPAPRAGRTQWMGLAVLALPALLVAMDGTALYFALPFLSADLRPSADQLLWITDSYAFLLAGLLVTMGALGDRIGRRRLLMAGAAAFGVASVLAAWAPTAESLIAARALLGIGGATLAPSTLGLIRAMFPDQRDRRTAIGVWGAAFAGGGVLGPVAGGVLLEHFWWGSVFLLNVPVMLLLLAVAPRLLPEQRVARPGRFDLLSAALSLGAVLPVVYGVKTAAVDGWGAAPAAAIAAGVVVGALFVRRQRRTTDPMVDLVLFRNAPFAAAVVATTVVMFTVIGVSLHTAQYLQLVLGMEPLKAALWSLPPFLTMPVGITLATVLVRRVPVGFVVAAGLALSATGVLLLATLDRDGLPMLLAAASVMTFGVGMVTTLTTELVVGLAPAERAGAASALSESANELGGALGVALLGTAGAAVYRGRLAETLPAGVPDTAAGAVRETLGAAEAVATALPAPLGDAVARAAGSAFVSGLHAVALGAAGVLAVTAVAAAVAMRGVPADAVTHRDEEATAGAVPEAAALPETSGVAAG